MLLPARASERKYVPDGHPMESSDEISLLRQVIQRQTDLLQRARNELHSICDVLHEHGQCSLLSEAGLSCLVCDSEAAEPGEE